MKQANIDVIYLGGYHTEAGLIVRQAREQGLNAPLIVGRRAGHRRVLEDRRRRRRGHADDLRAPIRASLPRPRPWSRSSRRQGFEPEGYTLYTYAAIQVWAAAADEAGATKTSPKVAEALRGHDFDTVIGKLGFDDKGDSDLGDYVWYVWKDGKYAEM